MGVVGLAVEQVGEGSAQEDGDDAGRSLMTTQSDLVAGRGDGGHQQAVVLEDCLEVKQDEQLVKLPVFSGVAFLSREQVLETAVGLDVVERPVGVLAAAVDLLEGLLVKEGSQAVLVEHFLQNLHNDHILVDRQACIIANGGNLKLVECYFIMFGLKRNANSQQFLLHLKQSVSDHLGDGAVVVLAKLLVAGWDIAGKCTPKQTEIVSFLESLLGNGEELLLQTQQDHCFLGVYSQFVEQLDSPFLEDLFRLPEEGFVVKSVAVVRDQQSGDVEQSLVSADVKLGQGVPDSIASGDMRAPQAARGKATAIAFALDENLASKRLLHEFLGL